MWIENEKLNVEVSGPEGAPVILFIHGAGGCAAQWASVAEILSTVFRTAAIDLPGHGASPCKDEPHTLGTYVSSVLAAAETLGAPVILCGHSMGGAIAMQAALDSPASVDRLILANTGARLRVFPALFDQLRSDYKQAVELMAQFAFNPETPAAVATEYKESLIKTDPGIVIQDFTICDGFDIMQRAAGIRQPSLILCCEKDRLTPPKYGAWLNENIGGSVMRSIPGPGHLAMLEAPSEFAAVVRAFLR